MNFSSHFRLNKSQRNGMFFLLLIIVFIQGVWFLTTGVTSAPDTASPMVDLPAAEKTGNDQLKQYPINPNYIDDFKGYMLGMSVEEIDRLFQYRASGKFLNSVQDF